MNISPEYLVGPLPGQHDLEILRGSFAQTVRRHDDGIADRKVHARDGVAQSGEGTRALAVDKSVLSPRVLGDCGGRLDFIMIAAHGVGVIPLP